VGQNLRRVSDMVERYDIGSIAYDTDGIVEDSVGDYVKYEDYKAEVGEIETLRETIQSKNQFLLESHKENKRLMEEIKKIEILLFAIIKDQGGSVEVSDNTLASILHYTISKERNEQTKKTIYYCD
jgi:hypothetical protein